MICHVCLKRMKMSLEFVKLFSLEMKVFSRSHYKEGAK